MRWQVVVLVLGMVLAFGAGPAVAAPAEQLSCSTYSSGPWDNTSCSGGGLSLSGTSYSSGAFSNSTWSGNSGYLGSGTSYTNGPWQNSTFSGVGGYSSTGT